MARKFWTYEKQTSVAIEDLESRQEKKSIKGRKPNPKDSLSKNL